MPGIGGTRGTIPYLGIGAYYGGHDWLGYLTAVCGGTADRTPYYKGFLHPGMQGNFGPTAARISEIMSIGVGNDSSCRPP